MEQVTGHVRTTKAQVLVLLYSANTDEIAITHRPPKQERGVCCSVGGAESTGHSDLIKVSLAVCQKIQHYFIELNGSLHVRHVTCIRYDHMPDIWDGPY